MITRGDIYIHKYSSPCGELLLGSYDGQLCLCNWVKSKRREKVDKRLQTALNAGYEEQPSHVVIEAVRQLDEYFAGKRTEFDVPLLLVGTEFQKRVWQELSKIPYGTTITYLEQSMRLGKASAVRAVANANGDNAISLFVPCHRVVAINAGLGGYGGGLDAKRFLIDLEK